MMARPEMQLRATCESMVPLQPGSAQISMTPVTTKGHADAQDLSHHLRLMLLPEGYAVTGMILIGVACTAIRARVTSMTRLLLRTMSRSMVLLQPRSALMYETHVTTKDSTDT